MVAALLLGVLVLVWVVMRSERVLMWMLVSLLLAMALNPAVDTLQRHGFRSRGAAAGFVYALVIGLMTCVGALLVPSLSDQISAFADALPGYVRDLTAGNGPLGFLEERYHVVERVEDAVSGNGDPASLAGGADAALDLGRGVLTFVAGAVTITFLTLFMLLEGPRWVARLIELLPARQRPEAREIADEIYELVGRYVTGNLLISLIAGTVTTVFLLIMDVPFALALGLLVAFLDLIPLAGATLAAVIVTLVALTQAPTTAVIVLVYFIVYQQLENHLLQPIVYGRTVRLSPLAILLSVLIGVEVAGIIGALAAIPVGGTVQILLDHWRRHRRDMDPDGAPVEEPEPTSQATRPGRLAHTSLR